MAPHTLRTSQESPMPAKQRIAAIYARVSTTDQADKGFSLSTQRQACLDWAQQAGYVVPEPYIFVDDYPGTSLTRPQLKQLREIIRNRCVQVVLVHDLDRLSRKLAHQLLLSEEIEQAGVALHCVMMPTTEKTPETQLLANVRGIIAEYERSKILERTERGRRGRAKAGFVSGGITPLGYRYIRSMPGGTYEIHPEEAALVKRIFRMYIQEGLSIVAIAQHLTAAGVPTPNEHHGIGPRRKRKAGVWQPSSLHEILSNEAYIGTLYYGKRERTPSPNNPDRKTTWRWKPKEEWIAIPITSILDQETFQAAQARFKQNTKNSRRNRKYDYLLCNRRLRCGYCGYVMTGRYIPQKDWRYYSCNGYRYQVDHSRCRKPGADRLEKTIWEVIERALRQPEIIAAAIEERQQGVSTGQSDLERERRIFAGQIAQCDKELHKWEQAYIADAIDVYDLKAKKAEVMTRRMSLERELARVDEQQQLLERVQLETASVMTYCQRVRQNLTHFTMTEKRLALEALNISVLWHPDKPLEISGSIPVDIASDTF